MRIDDLRETGNVDDRRGRGGFALGGVGVLVVVVVSYFLGVDPSQFLNSVETNAPQQQKSSGPRADDAAYAFSRKIVGSAEDLWTPILRAKGVDLTPATLTVYDNATPTGCGTGTTSAGPFYARKTITSIWTCRSSTNCPIASARRANSRRPMSSRTNTAITFRL